MSKEMSIEIGRRLKVIREYRHMKQNDVAAALNTKQQVISQYEKGKRNITIALLMKFCNVLNVDLACFDPRRELVIWEPKTVLKYPGTVEEFFTKSELSI